MNGVSRVALPDAAAPRPRSAAIEPLSPARRLEPASDAATPEARAPRQTHIWRWIVAIVLLGAALMLDFVTGEEVSSSLYYVAVVFYATWFLGRQAGLLVAALSCAAWLAAYLLVGHPFKHTVVLVWNLIAEGAIYSALALVLAALQESFRRAHDLAERLRVANVALDRETESVGKLQRDLLPAAPPRIPGYEWGVHYETSTRAGGDYFDFFALPGGRVGIFLADASGHGAPAAVLMAMTRALVHEVVDETTAPDRVLARLSGKLGRLLPDGWFVTACFAALDPATGEIEYSLAGHDAPWIVRSGSRSLERLGARGGPMLGPFPDVPFAPGRARLAPGDLLVLYTDGLTEAEDGAGRLLGEDAVRDTLESCAHERADDARRRLLERVARHRAGAAPSDDLTLLILGRAA